jgi:hypothetical protein
MKVMGWTALAGALLCVALLIGALVLVGQIGPGAVIEINGEPWQGLSQLGVGQGLGAVAGAALALLIVVLVVPVAVLLPLAFVGLLVLGLLAVLLGVVAGVAALVFSPLMLLLAGAWLLWRLVCPRPAPAPAALPLGPTDATIVG